LLFSLSYQRALETLRRKKIIFPAREETTNDMKKQPVQDKSGGNFPAAGHFAAPRRTMRRRSPAPLSSL
ncbi:MAG: hypothetical protein IKX21_06695, partial [Deltaproteobacteria bacterium]|nr:hypothetical protein [Deltaproteobacteria bacterium]